MKCRECRLLMIALLAVLSANIVLANGGHEHIVFPQWTYYGEISEHTLLMIIALFAIIFLTRQFKESKKKKISIINAYWVIYSLFIPAPNESSSFYHIPSRHMERHCAPRAPGRSCGNYDLCLFY